jgi:hypothetical protein
MATAPSATSPTTSVSTLAPRSRVILLSQPAHLHTCTPARAVRGCKQLLFQVTPYCLRQNCRWRRTCRGNASALASLPSMPANRRCRCARLSSPPTTTTHHEHPAPHIFAGDPEIVSQCAGDAAQARVMWCGGGVLRAPRGALTRRRGERAADREARHPNAAHAPCIACQRWRGRWGGSCGCRHTCVHAWCCVVAGDREWVGSGRNARCVEPR